MPDWTLSMDPARLDLDRIYGWLSTSYWSPGIRRPIFERAFRNSLSIGGYDATGAQLGVARVVTDEATFAWLCDVFVAPEARGRGLARAMVGALLAEPRLATLRRWCLGTRDAHGVYAPLGFAPVNPAIWMEYRPPVERWSGDAPAA